MKGKTITILMMFILCANLAYSAKWVNNPVNCPTADESTYPGFSCSPTDICGDLGGTGACGDTSTYSAPSSTRTGQTYQSGFTGGYIYNCYGTSACGEPNTYCNEDTSCRSGNRITTCAANKYAYEASSSTCGVCKTGYTYCDGNLENGCEIQISVTNFPTGANNHYTSSCTAECDSGYEDCDATGAGVGNGCEWQVGSTFEQYGVTWTRYSGCVASPDKSYFETGTNAVYYTEDPLLWGTQVGEGSLMNLSNGTTEFIIDNSGCLIFSDGTIQCSAGAEANNPNANYLAEAAGWTTDELTKTTTDYKVGIGTTNPGYKLDVNGNARFTGDLYIEGNTYLSDLNVSGFTVLQDVNATNFIFDGTGNVADNLIVDTDTLYVDSVNNRVGIGTTSVDRKLEIVDNTNLQLRLGTTESTFWDIGRSQTNGYFQIVEGSIGNVFSIRNGDGNVGIAIVDPSEKLDVDGNIRSTGQLISTLATGTAPLVVASTTKVTNLNADLLDGYDSTYFMVGTTDNWVDESGDTMSGTLNMGNNAITNIDWASSDDGLGSGLDADYLDGKTTSTTSGNGVIYISQSDGDLPDNTVNSATVDDNTLTAADLAADSVTASEIATNAVGNLELFDGGDWITTSSLNIGTNGAALSISTDGYLLDEDDSLTIDDTLKVTGSSIFDSSVTAASFVGNGASITSLNAGNIISGTLNTDRYDAYNDLSVSSRFGYNADTDIVLKSDLAGELATISSDYLKRSRDETITGAYSFTGGDVVFDADVYFKKNVTFVNAQSTRANTTFEVTDITGDTQSLLTVSGDSGQLILKDAGTTRVLLDAEGESYFTQGVGIGVSNPDAKLHIQSTNTGVASDYATAIVEDADAQIDITSSKDGSWGSALNLIEGNGATNTDVWSIARQTTGGSGDSSLRINYGAGNTHANPTLMTIQDSGNVGIGTTNDNYKLEVAGTTNLNNKVKVETSEVTILI